MMTARILIFPRPTRRVAAGNTAGEPVSPFRHLMSARPLTARETLHRRRMVEALGGGYRFTRINTDSEYNVQEDGG